MKPFVLLLFLMLCHVRGQMQGGTNAKQGEFPYAVQVTGSRINYITTFRCTGTIIHRKWVVTAAHCTQKEGTNLNMTITAGDVWREPSKIAFGRYRREYTATNVIQHPCWNSHKHKKNDRPFLDIALLYFKDGITFNPWTRSIDYLPAITPKSKDECKVMGWGNTVIYDYLGDTIQGVSSRRLKHAKLKVYAQSETKQFKDPKGNTYNSSLIAVMFSSELYKKTTTTRNKFKIEKIRTVQPLKGDSGGPLVCQNSNQDVLCGVSSVRSTEHDESGMAAYNSFEDHLKWINETMMSAYTAEHNNQQGQQRQQGWQQRQQNRWRSRQKQQNQDQANYFAAAVVTGLAGILFAYRRG